MPQLGVDYANTDKITAPGVAGFTKAKAVGTRIVIPRAVYGRGNPIFRDTYWGRDKADIVGAGLIRSAYIFICMPRSGFVTPEPEAQVDAFIDYVKRDLSPAVEGKRNYDMVPFFDVEEDSSLGGDAYFQWILRAAKRLREFYGAWPGMYTSNRVWQEHLLGHLPGQLAACPLWLAKPWPWPINTPVHLTGMPVRPALIPQFGNSWAIYQYAGDALGMPGFLPGAVDTNTVNLVGQGAKGQWVMWIQARAGGLVIDGDFGPKTADRVREIQALHALDADGLVGADTIACLAWMNPAPL